MYTATADALLGRVLEGRYRIQAMLARGGMSTVYTAVDERLDRLVAVKIMSPSLSADPAFTDRFGREARSAAKLTHLNAVSVYDQGFDQGESGPLVFLVMELVSGRTLRELLRERTRLSPAEAVSIMEPVLAALAAAHRAGIVHRDIKPENILLADDGVVKVADFGLARAVEADTSASTRTGLMMGTVAYCSPEQISRGRTDQRSDVYSAGIVLYELLTGAAPYTGDSAVNIAYQHVHARVPAPSSRIRGIAPQLDDLVRRATDSDPGGRPLDAGAMLAELADVRADLGLPVVAVPPRPRATGGSRSAPRLGADASAARTTALRGDQHRGDQHRTDPLDRPGSDARTVAVAASPAARSSAAPWTIAPATRGRLAPNSDRPGPSIHSWAPGEPPAGPPPPIVIPPPAPARSTRSRRRRTALIVIVILALLGAAAGYGGWWLASGRWAKVPDVANQSQSVATSSLQRAGFKVSGTPQQVFSETVAKDAVVATAPGTGSRVHRGGSVTLIVSKGQDRITIPSVAGLSQTDGTAQLQALRIKLAVVDQASDTVQKGVVLGTAPGAGTLVKPGTAVQLIVSSGPPVLTVPNVVGRPQADASSAITNAGFKVAVKQDYSSTVNAGLVISQDPSGDGQLVKFQTVTITVSKGPQTVVVPPIPAYTTVDAATAALKAVGLNAKVVYQQHIGGKLQLVVGADPVSGATVPVGSTVTLYAV
ncbi:MAG: Stk1 family PASTA domain-containing Ser/Thr kinase [Actinobacteria bacterium]|nr:Stk1 family PASTA domain-containing Ser/Thr kinase [Actinomycetota bacterium]